MSDKYELRHFVPGEFVDFNNMDWDIIKAVDIARHVIGQPFKITASNATTGHTKKSVHKEVPCRAIDGMFRDRLDGPCHFECSDVKTLLDHLYHIIYADQEPLSILDKLVVLRLAGVARIGLYPQDKKPNNSILMHLDTADERSTKLWVGLDIEKTQALIDQAKKNNKYAERIYIWIK